MGTFSNGFDKTGVTASRTRRFAAMAAVALLVGACVACGGGGSKKDDDGSVDDSRPGIVPATVAAAPPPQVQCPAPQGFTATSVQLGLVRNFSPADVISFGLPLAPGAVKDPASISVSAGGKAVSANVKVLLSTYDANGAATGPRSVLIQIPASVLQGDCTTIDIAWGGGAAAAGSSVVAFANVSSSSAEVVDTAVRTIKQEGGENKLVQADVQHRVLFTGRELNVLATFPDGYLAGTGILGHLLPASQVGSDLAGLKFISDSVTPFGLSEMFQESYPLNPDAVVGPDDLDEAAGITGYEAWLYDRCATFLTFTAHTNDLRFLREAYRSCSYYESKIELNGENRGIFTGKEEPDPKYSHLRGLYVYYALTGDDKALAAGTAIAELWLNDTGFVGPYLDGHLRGPDKLWTERLLGTSVEGLYYGHLLTGNTSYLDAVKKMVSTATLHLTGDKAALAALNPGSAEFPPQNCFIHNSEQATEGDADDPWCSGWMPVLLIDSLIAYQDQTNDPRVDEIFIRLTRFLRDTGSSYFQGDLLNDSFLKPSVRFDANAALEDQRVLVPLYGAGVDTNGKVQHHGEFDDAQHCVDATALTAAALRALGRTGAGDKNPVGPFPNEEASFLAMHNEFAFCAYQTFTDQTRPGRDPARFTSEDLAEGVSNPAKFVLDNKVGFPTHNVEPQRKLSWWFNTSLDQFALLKEAKIAIPELKPGAIQP